MEATVFNPLQIHLLQMFALDKSQNGLKELKDVLYRHYSAKMGDRLDTLWQSGKLNQERLDEINEMDLHTILSFPNDSGIILMYSVKPPSRMSMSLHWQNSRNC